MNKLKLGLGILTLGLAASLSGCGEEPKNSPMVKHEDHGNYNCTYISDVGWYLHSKKYNAKLLTVKSEEYQKELSLLKYFSLVDEDCDGKVDYLVHLANWSGNKIGDFRALFHYKNNGELKLPIFSREDCKGLVIVYEDRNSHRPTLRKTLFARLDEIFVEYTGKNGKLDWSKHIKDFEPIPPMEEW